MSIAAFTVSTPTAYSPLLSNSTSRIGPISKSLADFQSSMRASGISALAAPAVNVRTVGSAQRDMELVTPFTTTKSLKESLFDRLASFKILTSKVAMYLDLQWRNNFFAQLDNLLAEESWDPEDMLPTLESFNTLIRMLLFLNPDRRPGLGATGDGELIAAWTAGDDRLTVRCLPNDRVKWVLTCDLDGARESASGGSRLSNLKEILSPYRPERWFRVRHLSRP
jgi:hypothetical protein